MADNEEKPFNQIKDRKKYNQNKDKNYKSENDNQNNQNMRSENEKIDYYSDIRNNKENEDENNNNNINKKENKQKELYVEEIIPNSNIDIDNDELSQSLKNILLDKQFASPVIIKKENKIISDFHYVTFKNAYGENSCFVNVILHLLYNITELDEYLISLYEIDLANQDGKDINASNEKEINKFLVLLGKILYQYEGIINEENDKEIRNKNTPKSKVTVVKTLNMRKILANISSNKFPLNTIADPVELFNFILDILNEYLKEDLHKSFYLELIDEFYCKSRKKCEITIKNKYDKDNFIYHIYIDEILKYIDKKNLKVKDYKNKLFELSYKLFLSENTRICEKCKEEMGHNLVCMNNPQFLLINCVWKESNPIVDDVISLFFLMTLKDDLNNLFYYYNNNRSTRKRNSYYLLGFILYCFTLSHYIICIYNIQNNVFVLFDDEVAKEYNNIYELILDITVNILKINEKAFFYPVMLIFKQEQIYNNQIIRFNTLNDSEYSIIIKKCNEAIEEYQIQNTMKEEEKLSNYQDFIESQKEIENNIKKRNKRIRNSKNYHENINQKEKEINQKEINQKNNNDKIEINETENNEIGKKGYDRNKKDNSDLNEKQQLNNKEINELENEINNKKRNRNKNNINNQNNQNNQNIENNEDINNKKEQDNKDFFKKGLNDRNQSKIVGILQDLKKVKGERYKNNINFDDLKELEKIHNRNNENSRETIDNKKYNDYNEKEENNFYINNKRNTRLYKSQANLSNNVNIEDKEKQENIDKNKKEVYKKRTNIGENPNYYLRNTAKYSSKTPGFQEKNENDNITFNHKYTPYDNNRNEKMIGDNNNENENKRRRINNTNQNNIIWNNEKRVNKDNIINENINEENKIKEINKRINSITTNNSREKNTSYYTPKKDRFHSNFFKKSDNINEDIDNKKESVYNRSEKKTNEMKSFIGKKSYNPNLKTNEDNNYLGQKNKEENNNIIKNDNFSNNIGNSIRRKYYFRSSKQQ